MIWGPGNAISAKTRLPFSIFLNMSALARNRRRWPLGETVGLSRARTSGESPDSTQAGRGPQWPIQLAAISAHPAAMVGTGMPKLRGRTGNEAIVMPTAPSLERDSAPGGGPLEIRRSIASGTAASSRSRSPRSFHFLSIHLDPITRARARAAATQVGITKVVVSVSAYFFPPLPWFGGPEGAPCPVEG